jgi:hypothetical protein
VTTDHPTRTVVVLLHIVSPITAGEGSLDCAKRQQKRARAVQKGPKQEKEARSRSLTHHESDCFGLTASTEQRIMVEEGKKASMAVTKF